MTIAAAHHRALDRAYLAALGEPWHGHALVPSRNRLKDLRTVSSHRNPLTTLGVRTSAKGNAHLGDWLGKASVVAFAGDPDKHSNATWDVFLAQPEPRDGAIVPRQSPPPTEGSTSE